MAGAATPKHLASPRKQTPAREDSAGFYVFVGCVALLCSLYFECLHEIAGLERTGIAAGVFYATFTWGCAARLLVGTVCCFAAIALCARPRVLDFAVRYRWLLGAVALVVLVAADISGSSLGMWGSFLGEDSLHDTLWGIPRRIRSDEWLVFTPFSLAQTATGNPAVSETIRGCATDMTLVYAQPAWALATAFRPFLWGYLALGASRGLSFFWCARAVLLVLTTYDFMELVCRRRRHLAAWGTLLVAFSPLIEWWYAVNGTVELFVFGQGLVLCLHRVLRATTQLRRWGWSCVLGWLLGCYALIFYPAWQIPLVPVFAALGIADTVLWTREVPRKERPRARSIVVPLLVCAAVAFACVGLCLMQSVEALTAVTHTAYPGARLETGGHLLDLLPNTVTPLLSPLWPDEYPLNVCTSLWFFSLFPAGLVAAIARVAGGIRTRAVDPMLVALFAAYALLAAYGLLGFPVWLARITLLSNVPTGRLPMALGYADVVLLARALASSRREATHEPTHRTPGWLRSTLGTLALVATVVASVAVARRHAPELMGIKATLVLCAVLATCYAPLALVGTRQDGGRNRDRWLFVSAAVVLACSLCINPVQRGITPLSQSTFLDEAEAAASEDLGAVWLTDNSVVGQAIITRGIPTATCVNVYPNLERWQQVDPSGSFVDAYNRYAHISLALANKTSFASPSPDTLEVALAPEDVPKLGADYWLSAQDLAAASTDTVRFTPVRPVGALTLFRIE